MTTGSRRIVDGAPETGEGEDGELPALPADERFK